MKTVSEMQASGNCLTSYNVYWEFLTPEFEPKTFRRRVKHIVSRLKWRILWSVRKLIISILSLMNAVAFLWSADHCFTTP